MFNLYKHIEQLGKEHGYANIQKLCSAAGVTRSVMSELNNGRAKTITKKTAQKFADCLGVTIDDIYGTSRTFSDDDLKFALFGGEATDEQLEEVKRFAKFIQSR